MSDDIPEKRLLIRRTVVCAALLLGLWAAPAPAVAGIERLVLPNGVRATIYTEGYLRERLEVRDGTPVINLDGARVLPVITDIEDPAIYNKGDGSFHPFPLDLVVESLRAIDLRDLSLPVTVYILPFPRRSVLTSSTSGAEMFLSPHVLDIEPTVGAYIVTHETGHVLHNDLLPDSSPRWNEYRLLRGIEDPSRFSETASHAYRPKEIFAEDFRVLFGGPEAYFDGHVENPEITPPEMVAGLEGFFAELAARPRARETRQIATSRPNPFNPDTEIQVSMPPGAADRGARVVIRVYAVTGALVRELFSGVVTGDLAVRWDGTDRRGEKVASGTYYASVQAGSVRETLKLVLLE